MAPVTRAKSAPARIATGKAMEASTMSWENRIATA
jgi:hypothetical protein